ncbi:hypothetical protein ACQ1ZH_14410, partial [Enterococcus faecalis]|uniref:hypothetical protein n=1 Tax=Enterococcus faecalis TaxID=1351 RepID=UPI003D6BF6AE
QHLPQIYACRTNTKYTDADYSKVVAHLESLITNIESISSTPLTRQAEEILTQINNIRYEKNKRRVVGKGKILGMENKRERRVVGVGLGRAPGR